MRKIRSVALSLTLLLLGAMLLSSTYALAENVVVHVYKDGVSVSGNITTEYSGTDSERGSIILIVGDGSFSGKINISATRSNAKPPNVILDLNLKQVPKGSSVIVTGETRIRIWDRKGGITINAYNLNISTNLEEKTSRIKGTAELSASGEAASFVLFLPFLNKAMLEQMFEKYNIKGITINEFRISLVSPSKARIRFDVYIDYDKLFKNLNTTTVVNLTKWRKILVPASVYLHLETVSKNASLIMEFTVKADINEFLYNLISLVEEGLKVYESKNFKRITLHSNYSESEKYLHLLAEFVREFEIKPSRGMLKIRADPEAKRVYIEFATPKLIRRNGGVEDTFKEIYSLGISASKIISRNATEKLLNTTLRIVTEPHVKVLKGNTEVKEIKFKDLPLLKVVIEKPTTSGAKRESTTAISIATAVAVIIATVITSIALIFKKK